MDHQRVRALGATAEKGAKASATEARIQTAIGVVTGQGEIEIVGASPVREPGRDELAVGLDYERLGALGATAEKGAKASATEGRVQAAIGVVTGQGEVEIAGTPAIGEPRCHDLAVGLDHQCVGALGVTPKEGA